jgi:hypothetical protein
LTYRIAVAEAAAALMAGEKANWTLARLTFENTEITAAARTAGRVSLVEWAADVRDGSGRLFSDRTAGIYRRIWDKHGEAYTQGTISWAEAYDDVRGKTPDERMGDFNLKRGLGHATPEAKQAALAALSADPEVTAHGPTMAAALKSVINAAPVSAVYEALEDHPTRQAVYEALHQNEMVVADKTAAKNAADPTVSKLLEMQALADLDQWVMHVRGDIRRLHEDILPRLSEIPQAKADPLKFRTFIANALEQLDDALSPVRTFMATGTTDIDAFLKEVLGGKN